MTPLGLALESFRRSRGLQQNSLALSAGIRPCYLSAMEKGKKGPPYINHKDAQELLGVTKAQLKLIIDNDFIEDLCQPGDNYLKWLISKTDIEGFKEKLHKHYEHRDCDGLKVSEALSFYSTGFQELLPSLIKALLAGQITVVAKTEEMYLRDITMDKNEFIDWRKKNKGE